MSTKAHIAIIGAGPSGLMAAEILASAGLSITIYDRMPSVGRKLLMAGRGGLNLTHSEPLDVFLTRYGSAASWLAPYIQAFPPEALRAWAEGLGQETFIGSSGRIFPRSMKAAPLLRAWLQRLNQLGVSFAMRHNWQGWKENALVFSDAQGNQITVRADATLLALGGASWPRLGSNGAWQNILHDAGVHLNPLVPANCGFVVPWSEHLSSRFAGTPLKAAAITFNSVTRQGEVMITARGMEGGLMYAFSADLRASIFAQGLATMQLDLFPQLSLQALTLKLDKGRGSKSLSTYLRKAGLSPLHIGLLREMLASGIMNILSAAEMAAQLKSLPITFTATAGIERAISSAGGVARDSVDEYLMLRQKPGVFVAGEMLDWEAPTGGYLLQACFSTAVAAAKGMLDYLNTK